MIYKKLLVVVILATMLLLPSNCTCSKSVTLLSICEGNIQIKKSGTADFIEGKAGAKLKPGDLIQTGDNSTALITFFEGTTIELKPGTQVNLDSLEIAKTGSTIILLKQTIGGTISRVKKLADPESRYEIGTPAAVAGVRGSIMLVDVIQDGTTFVGNEEGKISVVAEGVEVVVPVGQHSSISPGQPPSPPQPGTKPLITTINNLIKNTGVRPSQATGNADWWYYDVILENKNDVGITLLKRQKHYTKPDKDWFGPEEDLENIFKNTYVPAVGKVLSRNNWIWFSRTKDTYAVTMTEIYYGKDDLGNEVTSSYTLTVDVVSLTLPR